MSLFRPSAAENPPLSRVFDARMLAWPEIEVFGPGGLVSGAAVEETRGADEFSWAWLDVTGLALELAIEECKTETLCNITVVLLPDSVGNLL